MSLGELMSVYIFRRIIAGIFVMLAASFILYMLMTQAGDPLAFTLSITNPTQRASVIQTVTQTLSLDVPPVERYFQWLQRLVFEQDFGLVSTTQQPVSEELARRIPMTLKLVTAATMLSVVVGVLTGIVTALRQYSGFDYLVTFTTFLFFSLPVFWVAVILKAWGGINLNDWLRDGAHFSVTFMIVMAMLAGVIGASFSGGSGRRKAVVGLITASVVIALLASISTTQWLLDPGFGLIGFTIISIGISVGVISVMAGWRNVRARTAALVTCGLGIVSYIPLQSLFDGDVSIWLMFGLLAFSIALATAVGYLVGGYDKGQAARTASIVAVLMGFVIFVDRMMQSWSEYSSSSVIRNRPIKTIGDSEARLEGSFWVIANNTFSHLVLPTTALMLISLAAYTRYSRASMLEVLNQDYIRTARAKGVPGRQIVIKHALRGGLLPVVAFLGPAFAGITTGSFIIEKIFQLPGLGQHFVGSVFNSDYTLVQATTVFYAALLVFINLGTDMLQAWLNPRVRLT